MFLTYLPKIFVYAVLFTSLLAALGTVLFPNIFHAALCLVGTLIGIAALYLALQAEFIAVIQVLLYVGAVMTLIIFAIMLTQRIANQNIPSKNNQSILSALSLIGFVALLGSMILKTPWPATETSVRVDALALGKALLGVYVFPFEVVSIVLIAALIGAVTIARKD